MFADDYSILEVKESELSKIQTGITSERKEKRKRKKIT